MADPTLEEILAPLVTASGTSEDELYEAFADVGANLARYWAELVAPRLESLARHLSYRIRVAVAVAMASIERGEREEAALVELADDAHERVSHYALLAFVGKVPPELRERIRARIRRDLATADQIRALAETRYAEDQELFRRAAMARDRVVRAAGLQALGGVPDIDTESLAVLIELMDDRGSRVQAGDALLAQIAQRGAGRVRLQALANPFLLDRLGQLIDRLDQRFQAPFRQLVTGETSIGAPPPAANKAPPKNLGEYGVVIDVARASEHAERVGPEQPLADLLALLTGEPRRSVLLVGPSGSGKTNLVHAIARALAKLPEPIPVLESSTSEVMAGTKFLGEWETKLKGLIDAARSPARVVVYFTDAYALGSQGRSQQREGSFADMLAPYLDRGELVMIGEATEEQARSGVERNEVMRRLFTLVRCPEASVEETRTLLRARVASAGQRDGAAYAASPDVIDQLIELSSVFAPGTARQGRASRVLDAVLRAKAERNDDSPAVESGDVVAALARSTGIPGRILDDRIPFDLAAARAFFEERVLGQPEAIDVMLELVTLIKAGLTDPERPYGSLFFVGPTGVGKTEIAKALAEFLYGASDRMVRFDMSEFRDWNSVERLIGDPRNEQDGQLTDGIREEPFSVVLLDEIEKAHANVHDLLLQILDDGRLTDARGRTVDFKRAVIVMTSNVGARIEVDAMGFGAKGDIAPSHEAVMRAVRQAFRPELVNRFGRVVVFRPLTPEILRTIVRRELGKIAFRSGVLRRRVVIDLAPDLVDLLAREGFSIAYGARPLRRRVERRVMLPIAEALVRLGADAAGTVLRVEASGERVVVRAIAPRVEKTGPQSDARSRSQPPPPEPRDRLRGLENRLAVVLQHPSRTLDEARRGELLERTRGLTFWDDAERAREELNELAELDDRGAAVTALERRVEGAGELVTDLVRGRTTLRARATEVLDDVERALALLEHRVFVERADDRLDVFLVATRLGATKEDAAFAQFLVGLYDEWAAAHDTKVVVLDEQRDARGLATSVRHLDGLRLHGLLRDEAGLHRLEAGGRGSDRKNVVVRLDVLAQPASPRPDLESARAAKRGKAKITIRDGSGASFECEVPSTSDAGEHERLARLFLSARIGGPVARDHVVRRYGIEGRFAHDSDLDERLREKDLANSGLDRVFEARMRARLAAARG